MHGQTYTTRCYGLNGVPLEFMCWIPNSLNVTIFEDRVFKEATEVKLNSKHYINSLVRVSYLPVSKYQYENIHTCMHACKVSPFSRVWLFVTSWAVACQSPLAHLSLQASILERAAMPSSREASLPRDRTRLSCVFCITGRFSTTEKPSRQILIGP